ncbi:hypothetical protein [Oceanicoccus sagamiensis]|uniref:Uncharacterized protein n=1 Tax=Oceanicoccus sagamiensis TaxID=716816 RepID=A0A1X9NH55_9GAMM|nr:hypothetical protein [Oceanicoccus sagamiensis]ARN75732.1 hypothetical protein BST96_17440 [Oceanicoccus sagamiensis]
MFYTERVFRGFDLNTGTWSDTLALSAAALAVVIYITIFLLRKKDDSKYYNSPLAWLRAFGFFSVCFALGAATGVAEKIISEPWGPVAAADNWMFVGGAVIFAIIIANGYLHIWPRGTYVKNRKFYWTTIPMGLIWGIAEGQLHLATWSLLEMTGMWPIATAVLTMVILPNYQWHMYYWDVYVEPGHNILETNMQKAGYSHIPNMAWAMVMMVLFAAPGLHVLMQTVALFSCAIAMRFPPPWKAEWHGKDVDPTGGRPAAEVGYDLQSHSFKEGYR